MMNYEVSGGVRGDVADVQAVPSDHACIWVRIRAPRDVDWTKKRIPVWVAKHPEFARKAEQLFLENDWPEDVWKQLEHIKHCCHVASDFVKATSFRKPCGSLEEKQWWLLKLLRLDPLCPDERILKRAKTIFDFGSAPLSLSFPVVVHVGGIFVLNRGVLCNACLLYTSPSPRD